MKTTPTITLPAAFLAIAGTHALIHAGNREALSSDGEIIVSLPLPDGFTASRMITKSVNDLVIGPDDGDATDDLFDTRPLHESAGSPAYRIALHPGKLAALAAALASMEGIILELPASPDLPIRILPQNGEGYGYIIPQQAAHGEEGLLAEAGAGKAKRLNSDKPAAELPPPVIKSVAERGSLEIDFGGKPAKEILDALKDPTLGFRYSGRGTRRGVPANHWYGPDNPFTRQRITDLLKTPITQAAA